MQEVVSSNLIGSIDHNSRRTRQLCTCLSGFSVAKQRFWSEARCAQRAEAGRCRGKRECPPIADESLAAVRWRSPLCTMPARDADVMCGLVTAGARRVAPSPPACSPNGRKAAAGYRGPGRRSASRPAQVGLHLVLKRLGLHSPRPLTGRLLQLITDHPPCLVPGPLVVPVADPTWFGWSNHRCASWEKRLVHDSGGRPLLFRIPARFREYLCGAPSPTRREPKIA